MQVEEELAQSSPTKDMVLTIGVFDGVHLGHKYLISQLKAQAKKRDLLSGVVTFSQHPEEVLQRQAALPFLTSFTQRIDLLKAEGIDAVIALSFTRELAQLNARQFASLLVKHLRMRGLVIGPDFALGRNREGDVNTLRTLGQEMNFSVTVADPLMINGGRVSSTVIRKALAEGDMGRVYRLAGRYFNLSAPVVTGAGRGRALGFPTANLDINAEQALPADGVYATWVYIGDKGYQSVTNIGRRPTFGSNQRTVEVFVLDHQGDLYGRNLKIDIIERLRGEKRFNTPQELAEQVAEDVKRGRAILNSRGRN